MESVSLTGPPPIQETPSPAFTLSIPRLNELPSDIKSCENTVVNSPSVPVPGESLGADALPMLRIPKIQFDSPSTEQLDASSTENQQAMDSPNQTGVQPSPLRHSEQ